MSTASRQSMTSSRRLRNTSKDLDRQRPQSRIHHAVVDHEEARSFALRAAYLHYLLQPKTKRKQYVSAPRPSHRSQASVGQLVQEYGSGNSSSLKLPHNFADPLIERVGGVLKRSESLPGFDDAAVKRSFAEAYTAFSERSFRKTIDKERKFEPLILIFYSAATKAAQKGRAPDDDTWKGLPDRHLALFVRLAIKVLRDHGHDRDRPELISRLSSLENKLLTNDQNLVGNGSGITGKTIEVVVPLTYDVKDMPLVQVVASIFGLSFSEVQDEINSHRQVWTEEAALKDLKSYQLRLSSNMTGALTSHDFDVEEAYDEWKKTEAPQLSHMIMDILTAKPELAKTSTGPIDRPLPSRPQSMFGDDQAYADLSRAISGTEEFGSPIDPAFSLASLNLGDTSSIRAVDDTLYTFIPSDPRAFYKYILQHAMTFDQIHADPNADYQPLSKPSLELLTELCVRWRIPQFSRLICLLEVAARKYLDEEIVADELDDIFRFIKEPQPEQKKPPHLHNHTVPLKDIEASRWTLHDLAAYKNTLYAVYDSLLRELFNLLQSCYDTKAPDVGAVMFILENHLSNDPIFSPRSDAAAEFSNHLSQALRQKAVDVYRRYMEKEVPARKEDWDFAHVVKLGKSVTKLCDRIRKRYSNMPDIMGVDPLEILVQEVFPNFEEDAQAIIQAILKGVQDQGLEMDMQDGFDLYRELVQLRRIHQDSLPPEQPFAFDIEKLLVDFVWRWIGAAEARMQEFVDEAIKQDQFQVRIQGPDQISLDSQRHSVSVIDLFMLFNQTLEQVYRLEWDNDEHHARFMNALSRSFSLGIGRYCEIVEQRFAREMDRPSAEEVAAQSQTTQEKWMQYAKDAWNNKEKQEPFHFFPESFVKLNNIEYAMQELDKLERGMNPDACAALLEKIDGPKKKSKKPSKYTFTIKIVEAEDLKACDPNGLSDPYVVFGDEYQKRLYKTRIIHRNLNPRWDETFDVTVQGPVNLIATVWDYDTFGDHDYVGRTSIKLDPHYFSDYLPREFWLDLDSQGRVLIRVSMEGERDDIHFHFGKAFRHLKRTERDMVRKITDKLTSQINATLSHETLRSLLGLGGLASSVTGLWKKRASTLPVVTPAQIEAALTPLFAYFDENFSIMKQTLTEATMIAVMTRLWKEVLMTIENLLVPPVSEKPSTQKPLTRRELDVVFHWLEMLFVFFNAKDEETGEQLGVPSETLKSSKWHELASLNFFYFEDTNSLIRESERMATTTAQAYQKDLLQHAPSHRGPASSAATGSYGINAPFASLGTIRRGKSIMMSRNLGTMRKAKEAKRREAQAVPSDDMILRILRMRPEAASYLKERQRQKERQAATAAAALIVKNSVHQGWNAGSGQFGRNNLPRR